MGAVPTLKFKYAATGEMSDSVLLTRRLEYTSNGLIEFPTFLLRFNLQKFWWVTGMACIHYRSANHGKNQHISTRMRWLCHESGPIDAAVAFAVTFSFSINTYARVNALLAVSAKAG